MAEAQDNAAADPASVAAQDPALIDDLTDPKIWESLTTSVADWAQANLFTIDTGIEIVLIVLAATVAWPVGRFLKKQLEALSRKHARYQFLNRLWRTLQENSFPIVWLAIQAVVVVVTDQLEIRNAALVVTTSLLTAWVVIQIASSFVANPFWSRSIAIVAWVVAALNILGLLDQTLIILDEATFTLGQLSISALTVIQGLIALGLLLWATSTAAQVIESKLKNSQNLTPSMQVLSAKLARIGLGTFAVLAAMTVVGVDLTALAVFGGAVGVGLGFGLQKIFANLVSGFILLLDKSIKPGDVIAVPDYYGRVDSLGARYVSVTTRDGIEHLIPNEDLITGRVENWSHSQNLLRLRKSVGVHYKSDVHRARELCLEAADETERVLKEPKPVCLLRDFGDSSVDLELRFWIDDPMNGRANVTSEVLTRIWDKFHEHGIEIPYPQRDLHLRSSEIGSISDSGGRD